MRGIADHRRSRMGHARRSGHWLAVGTAIAQIGLGSAAALAQVTGEELPEEQAAVPLEQEVLVTGYRFLTEDTSGTTGLPLSIEGVPQAISLVSNDFLNAADLQTLGDVAQFTAGALYAGNQDGFGTEVKLRGFSAGYAFNGLTIGSLNYEPDMATVERLEVVKGPASVVYGAASPGGLINLVPKSAGPRTRSYIELTGGSYERWRMEGQLAGALDTSGAVHGLAVGVYEEAGSFMKLASSDRTVFYGGLNAALGSSVTAYLSGGYERYRRTAFDGIPTFADGSNAPLDSSFFIGSRDFNLVTEVARANGGVDWVVSPMWSVSVKANYQRADTDGPLPYAYGLESDGTVFLSILNFVADDAEDLSVGISSVLKLDDVGLAGSFISVSALYQSVSSFVNLSFPTFGGADEGQANIFDGVDAIAAVIEAAEFPGEFASDERRLEYLTFSSQAVLKPVDPVTLLLGVSYSEPDIKTQSDADAWRAFSVDGQASYRAALSVEAVAGLNFYGSYSESFQPQLRINVNDDVLPPLAGKQFELGAKYVVLDHRLFLTAAAFQITQENRAEFDQVGPDGLDRYRPIGEVRHRGLEFEAVGRVSPRWQINAGLTLLDPKITRDSDPTAVGQRITYLPEVTASIFTSYEFERGFFVSGGVRHVGSVTTEAPSTLPAYRVVDAAAGFTSGNWRIQANVHNLLDETYYINNYQTLFYGNTVGQPRTFALSVKKVF